MKLFSQEVKDMNELNEVLKSNKEISKEYELQLLYMLSIQKIK